VGADGVVVYSMITKNILKNKLKNMKMVVCNITSHVGMILGMDIISLGDFALSNGNEQTLISFAVHPFEEK